MLMIAFCGPWYMWRHCDAEVVPRMRVEFGEKCLIDGDACMERLMAHWFRRRCGHNGQFYGCCELIVEMDLASWIKCLE